MKNDVYFKYTSFFMSVENMATFSKRKNGYLARVRLKGIERSKLLPTKADAKAWANQIEVDIVNKSAGILPKHMTFGDVICKYLEDVTPTKRGAVSEEYRLKRALKTRLADTLLEDLTPQDFGQWRDDRLKDILPASVNREMTTLSSVCNYAVKELGVMRDNMATKVTKPKQSKARTRRPTEDESRRLCLALSFDEEVPPELAKQRVAIAYLFAIETGMRAGEICALEKQNIKIGKRLARVETSKNGHPRDVPMSKRALELIELLYSVDLGDSVFGLKAASLDAIFRKAKADCEITDLHFHDTRREALTRMAKKVDVMILAKISGHRDIRILLNTYYAPDASSWADMLD